MPFDYWHRKQTGGRGEYARVIGYIEPLPAHLNTTNEFLDRTTGTNVPAQFKPGIKKGFFDYCEKGQVYHYHVMNRQVLRNLVIFCCYHLKLRIQIYFTS